MREESNQIENFGIYSDDDTHRYLLARIWDKEAIPFSQRRDRLTESTLNLRTH